jgi:hypothetical protein
LCLRTLPPKAPQSSSEWPPGAPPARRCPSTTNPDRELANRQPNHGRLPDLKPSSSLQNHFPNHPFLIKSLPRSRSARLPYLSPRNPRTAHLPPTHYRRFPQLAIRPTRWRPSPTPITPSTRRRSTWRTWSSRRCILLPQCDGQLTGDAAMPLALSARTRMTRRLPSSRRRRSPTS